MQLWSLNRLYSGHWYHMALFLFVVISVVGRDDGNDARSYNISKGGRYHLFFIINFLKN